MSKLMRTAATLMCHVQVALIPSTANTESPRACLIICQASLNAANLAT